MKVQVDFPGAPARIGPDFALVFTQFQASDAENTRTEDDRTDDPPELRGTSDEGYMDNIIDVDDLESLSDFEPGFVMRGFEPEALMALLERLRKCVEVAQS